MSTLKLETFVPQAGVNKSKSRIGLAWDRLTKPVEEPPYRPLPEYYIRVAKIKPGTRDHPLRVKLKHIDPRTTKYIALSYTWDQDPSPLTGVTTNSSADSQSTLPPAPAPEKPQTTTLLCGGTPFRVRQNLYDALCQIRDVQCDVPVFVDALCINFNNNAERTNYLEIMGHIYSRAASVIVYLGPKSSHTDSILRIMRQLVNAIDWRRIEDPSNHDSQQTPTYNFRDPRFFQNLGMEPLNLKQWRAIHDFCHMRWFTRYWSFFELALAKNALFLWGESCMDYNFLHDFSMILTLSGWLDELRQISTDNLSASTFDSETDPGLIKMLVPVAQLRSSPPWSPKSKDFENWMRTNHGLDSETAQAWQFFEILLQYAEPFDCYNPRDKVYAPLALARAVFAGKAMNKNWPTPDYLRSIGDVYADFAGPIARYTGKGSIIAGMEGFEGINVGDQIKIMDENRNAGVKGIASRPASMNSNNVNGSRNTNENRNSGTARVGSKTADRNSKVNETRNTDVSRVVSQAKSHNGNVNGQVTSQEPRTVDINNSNISKPGSRSGSRNGNHSNANRNTIETVRSISRNSNPNPTIQINGNETRHTDVDRAPNQMAMGNTRANLLWNNKAGATQTVTPSDSRPASRNSENNRSGNNSRAQSRNGKLSKKAGNRKG